MFLRSFVISAPQMSYDDDDDDDEVQVIFLNIQQMLIIQD